jgi:hypothetical protein
MNKNEEKEEEEKREKINQLNTFYIILLSLHLKYHFLI